MVRAATKEQLKKAENNDYLTLDKAFCRNRSAERITGSVAWARTAKLASRVCELLSSGASPDDILVVCPTPSAASAFSALLGETSGEAARVSCTTGRAIACEILACTDAQAAIGRTFPGSSTRILSAFEDDFLMEDAKTIGMRPKRLKEVMKFLRRGESELADECDGWLVTVEEHDIVNLLHDELRYMQAVAETEISNLATKACRANADVRARFSRKHIFVSEYQHASRATQLLCNLLATDSIVISADASASAEVYESYPYAAGVEEFLEVNPCARTSLCELPERGCAVSHLEWQSPDEEIAGIIEAVKKSIQSGVSPEKIAIVCFHPQSYNKFLRALIANGVAVGAQYGPLALRGDIRSIDAALALRMVSVLRLIDNLDDSMSWRAWVGYGDYLGKSNAFVPAREQAQAKNPDAHFAESAISSEAGQSLCRLIENCKDKHGKELLEYIACALSGRQMGDLPAEALVPKPLFQLLELGDEASAHEMVTYLEKLQFFPQLARDGVVLTSLFGLAGLAFDEVYAAGFVNGYFPKHAYFDLAKTSINQQKRMADADAQSVKLLTNAARSRLVLSSFSQMDQEAAERLGVKQERIFVESDGACLAQCSPSIYIPSLLSKPDI